MCMYIYIYISKPYQASLRDSLGACYGHDRNPTWADSFVTCLLSEVCDRALHRNLYIKLNTMGPKDHINMRILDSDSKAQGGIPDSPDMQDPQCLCDPFGP